MGFIIGLLLIGLIAGFLARALVPGRDPMGIVATIVLGVVGSFVGGFLARLLFNDQETTAGLIGSVIGAVIVLLIYNAATRRRATV
ncbi:MAG: GlsB/YeaQ/YmgE family stress response membrane protein [Acidimicrobiales bacterium]|nr:GlsB/YeaQ/YmgE family stress response membrane protein [Actinomycetota bacterium]